MTPEQEQAVTEALGEGLSERETARRVGVSPTAVHRISERLAHQEAAQDATPAETAAAGDEHQAGDTGPFAAELDELCQRRGELATIASAHEERAAAARAALGKLETERSAALAAGRDAAPLRPKMREAADDLADAEEAARLAREPLAPLDAEIARIQHLRVQAQAEHARQAARAEAARLAALAPGAMREAFAQAREAAAGFVAVAQALKAASGAAGTRVVPELTARTNAHRDPWFDSVMVLWRIAEGGDVRETLRAIVNCGDWQERDAGVLARERAEAEARRQQMAADAERNLTARNRGTPGAGFNRGVPMPGVQRVPSTEHIDEYGRKDGPSPGTLTPFGGRLIRPMHPSYQG
jgi:hypothetical protein